MLAYPQRGIGFQPVFCYPKVSRIVRWDNQHDPSLLAGNPRHA